MTLRGRNVKGGIEPEQKNNNLSYCNGFQKCNKSCTWYGSFDPKKVILDFQDVFRNKIEIQNWILQL